MAAYFSVSWGMRVRTVLGREGEGDLLSCRSSRDRFREET